MAYTSPAACASESKEITRCAAMKDSVKRLECFDSLATRLGADKPSRETSEIGQWKIEKEISKIDDSANISLSLKAGQNISGWPRKISRPTLFLRCKEKNIDAYVGTNMTPAVEHGLHDATTATLRFDKDKALQEEMSESTDHNALFFKNPVDIISKMFEHGAMLFQFTPSNSSPVMTTFNLAGLKKAIQPLTEACKEPWGRGTKQARFKSLLKGASIKLTLKGGTILSGIFSSYYDEVGGGLLYLDVIDTDGKKTAFKSYTNDDILSVEVVKSP
jgi:type VI secretion system protein VasI